jgi:hypothetical protein
MTPRTGRPIEGEERKDIKLQIRVDRPTLNTIDALAEELQTTRTGVIMRGIELVRNSLKK